MNITQAAHQMPSH